LERRDQPRQRYNPALVRSVYSGARVRGSTLRDVCGSERYLAAAFVSALRWQQIRVLGLERLLNLNRAIYRLDHAGEFGQDAIASPDYRAVALTD
jgi:hypothetical protein